MKFRIHPHFPNSIKDEIRINSPFVNPTLIKKIRYFFYKTLIEDSEIDENVRRNLISNISFSLQWLEFNAAMLFENYERIKNSQKPSLNTSIETMMILQYYVFCYSILEGLGSYQARYNQILHRREYKKEISIKDWSKGIDSSSWKKALLDKIQLNQGSHNMKKLSTYIQNIIDLRHEVHLDTLSSCSHYFKFSKDEFKLAHNSLRLIILGIDKNDLFPKNSIILEEFNS